MRKTPSPAIQIAFLLLVHLLLLTQIQVRSAIASNHQKAPTPFTSPFRFEHITPDEGLPSLAVQAILQDSEGFIWFATFNGLYRWDGYSFKGFHYDPDDPRSLSGNNVGALFEDRHRTLWIGTMNSGLNSFDRNTGRFVRYRHIKDDTSSLSHNRINAISEDSEGDIWVGTDGGLDRFIREKKRFIRYQHNPADPHSLSANQVRALKSDSSGTLWVGTQGGGLNRFDLATNRVRRYLPDSDLPNRLGSENVWAIAIDNEDIVWIGTEDGLNRFDPRRETFTRFQHEPDNANSLSDNDISSIHIDSHGMLWIGTTGGGLNHLDPSKMTITRLQHIPGVETSFKGSWVGHISEDRTGALWFATLTDGVNRLDSGAAKFELYQHNPGDPGSLSQNATWAIFQDRLKQIWIGTIGGGLNRFDPETGRFNYYNNEPDNPHSLSDNQVYAITEGISGDLWIGTRRGLNRFHQNTQRFSRYLHDPENPESLSGNWISTLYSDRKGRLWIGIFGGGFNRFDHSTNTFRRYSQYSDNPISLSDNRVIDIVEDREGILWLATHGGGLNRFNPDSETFIHYRHKPGSKNSLSSDQVTHLYLDSKNIMWLATSGGLDKLNLKTGVIKHYSEKNGLPSNNVVSVVPDGKGYLWLGTHGGGLSRFDIQSETFKNYDQNDGLQSNEFVPQGGLIDDEGKLYFTGKNGLNAFWPDNFTDNPHIPAVVLTDFLVFNNPVDVGEDTILQKTINETDEIVLSHRESVFSFEFAALSFRSPQKNRYAYRLEGFDEQWNYVDSSRRFATYTNLDAGTYTFRVKASNNDGLWNKTGKQINITIVPPWWRTGWFYLICTLTGLGFISLIYRTKSRQMAAERDAVRVLQESEERLQQIASNIPGVIYQLIQKTDGSYEIPYISEKSKIVFDLSAEKLIENPNGIFDIIYKDDLERMVNSMLSSATSVSTWQAEFRIKQENSEIKWIRGASVPHRTENGDLLWNGVFLDITEQKRAEEALKESEEKYRKVVDNAIEGICVIQDSQFRYFNPRAVDLFGYTAEELSNMDTDETVFPDDRPKIASIKNRQMKKDQTINTYSHRVVTKEGLIRWAEVKAVTIIWEKRPAVLVFLTDITERKRTEELMIQTEKMMSVGGLAAGMAHELNNPLSAILQGAQNIARRMSPDLEANRNAAAEAGVDLHGLAMYIQKRKITNYLEGIRTSGKKAAEIISNMLQFSRKSESNMAPKNLAELIENVLELAGKDYNLEKKYDFREVQIIKEFDATLPPVPCIETELEQVMLNILINSAWAMGSAESDSRPSIVIRLVMVDSMARIEVEDNGPGMDGETRKRIFEPFFTTKPVGEGTGLGLSVSYMIITNNHKGTMEVESKLGIGTKFVIQLPLFQD